MRAAFEYGADIVELDIHPTKDGQFAVFHDWTLDCRTDGSGVTREKTMEELKKLDIGYGYTADGGKTYPFRGKGIGLMPTLDEVLSTFPDRSLLIHIKSDDPQEGVLLADRLPNFLPSDWSVWRCMAETGRSRNWKTPSRASHHVHGLAETMPAPIRGDRMDRDRPGCLQRNSAPHSGEYAAWLWGWPNRFLSRMEQAGTRIILVKYVDGFSGGFDRPEDLKDLPKDYSGGIWTNRIDRIAPLLKTKGLKTNGPSSGGKGPFYAFLPASRLERIMHRLIPLHFPRGKGDGPPVCVNKLFTY